MRVETVYVYMSVHVYMHRVCVYTSVHACMHCVCVGHLHHQCLSAGHRPWDVLVLEAWRVALITQPAFTECMLHAKVKE